MQKVYLKIVEPLSNASIIKPASNPGFIGDEDTSLACGDCKAVIAKGLSVETMQSRFAAPAQFIVRCADCGANNCIPTTVGR